VLGALISAYLTVAHYSGAALVCTQGAGIDCNAVTTSSYSLVPGTGIPISLAGLAWSIATAFAGVLALRAEPAWLRPALLVWSAAGVAAVLYLVNAELSVIHAICEWCTAVHLLVGATFFIALTRMRSA
jgi:uncharacterized membrane protein